MREERPTTVLTIEDEPMVRQSMAAYLADRGYAVVEAENGRAGVEAFRHQRPDIILADLRMPELDGLGVLEIVSRESPRTPMIVVSGAGLIADAIEALHRGAWDYLVKPIEDLAILVHAIEKALERARLIRENERYQNHLEEEVSRRTAELEAANAELVETRMQIIRRLAKAAEYKDNETGKHVVRVGLYSRILACGVNLDPEIVELISLTSPMHDLGKIGIPDSILQKPGSLDYHEWSFMKQHCAMGVAILKPLSAAELEAYREHPLIGRNILQERDTPLLRMAADIAAYHHEHWDGTGYPEGLSGAQIPLPARIVAVADAYDAMASQRPYKPPFPHNTCCALIAEASGTQLDPDIVSVFLESTDRIVAIREEWKDEESSGGTIKQAEALRSSVRAVTKPAGSPAAADTQI